MSMAKDLLKRLMLKVAHVYGKGGPWSPQRVRKIWVPRLEEKSMWGGVQWYLIVHM